MRVKCKWRDYYDLGMQFGQDQSIYWYRETEQIEVNSESYGVPENWFFRYCFRTKGVHNTYTNGVNVSYLAFCGKLYEIHKLKITTDPKEQILYGNSFADMKDRFEKHTAETAIYPADPYPYFFKKQNIYEYHTWLNQPCHDLHFQLNCPILLLKRNCIIKCPVLREMDVQRLIDPYTAYQDLSQYISGVLGSPSNPTVDLSDKSKVLKHGFDPKYGFRTRKEKE